MGSNNFLFFRQFTKKEKYSRTSSRLNLTSKLNFIAFSELDLYVNFYINGILYESKRCKPSKVKSPKAKFSFRFENCSIFEMSIFQCGEIIAMGYVILEDIVIFNGIETTLYLHPQGEMKVKFSFENTINHNLASLNPLDMIVRRVKVFNKVDSNCLTI